MKFLADMGISPRCVAFLNHLGHDAYHLHDKGLHRLSDADVLGLALEEGRILLTHDLDFAGLMAASRSALPSIILFRLKNMAPDNVEKAVQEILRRYPEVLKKGAIISVTEGVIRIRNLPISAPTNP